MSDIPSVDDKELALFEIRLQKHLQRDIRYDKNRFDLCCTTSLVAKICAYILLMVRGRFERGNKEVYIFSLSAVQSIRCRCAEMPYMYL